MSNSLLELMNRRQRQLLVHSFLYYQLNENIVTDSIFDSWSKEIVDLMKSNPDIAVNTVYYDAFKGFDGSSGYDLPYSLPNIQKIGYGLLERKKKVGK